MSEEPKNTLSLIDEISTQPRWAQLPLKMVRTEVTNKYNRIGSRYIKLLQVAAQLCRCASDLSQHMRF